MKRIVALVSFFVLSITALAGTPNNDPLTEERRERFRTANYLDFVLNPEDVVSGGWICRYRSALGSATFTSVRAYDFSSFDGEVHESNWDRQYYFNNSEMVSGTFATTIEDMTVNAVDVWRLTGSSTAIIERSTKDSRIIYDYETVSPEANVNTSYVLGYAVCVWGA